LDDKERQSLERAFRLLKILHPREDIHRAHDAALSKDKRARANAVEFLDALLSRRDQQSLRELLRVVVDDAEDAERVAKAAVHVGPAPKSAEEAIKVLLEDRDEAVGMLAGYHALALGGAELQSAVERARRARPTLLSLGERLFRANPLNDEASGA
jgi:hypothetical protein